MMTLDDLQKGFFGYQKASVYQYIASIEQDFSEKLMEKDQQLKTMEAQYAERVQKLEAELAELKKEFDGQKSKQMNIAAALLDAQHYAETLKKQTEEKELQARQELEKSIEKSQREIDSYQAQVKSVREMLAALLKGLDESAEKLETHIERVKTSAPAKNMSLFERRKKTDDSGRQPGRK